MNDFVTDAINEQIEAIFEHLEPGDKVSAAWIMLSAAITALRECDVLVEYVSLDIGVVLEQNPALVESLGEEGARDAIEEAVGMQMQYNNDFEEDVQTYLDDNYGDAE